MKKLIGWICACGFGIAAIGFFWDVTTHSTATPLTAADTSALPPLI